MASPALPGSNMGVCPRWTRVRSVSRVPKTLRDRDDRHTGRTRSFTCRQLPGPRHGRHRHRLARVHDGVALSFPARGGSERRVLLHRHASESACDYSYLVIDMTSPSARSSTTLASERTALARVVDDQQPREHRRVHHREVGPTQLQPGPVGYAARTVHRQLQPLINGNDRPIPASSWTLMNVRSATRAEPS